MGGGSGDSPCFSGLDGGEGEREMCDLYIEEERRRGTGKKRFEGLEGLLRDF